MSTQYSHTVLGDVETAAFLASGAPPQEVSGGRKAVKWFTGFALLAGCAAMAYRSPSVFGPGPHVPPAGKVEGIQGMWSLPWSAPPLPAPFELDPLPHGKCQGDSFVAHGGQKCHAPWVYCTDARCDSHLKEKNGVLIAECLCWMPKKSVKGNFKSLNESIIPKETSGAGCVYNQVKAGSYPFRHIGGDGMCDEMKKGKLISTYGPLGHAPPARAVKCAPKTPWAWCWGAPCEEKYGKIICDCPIVISKYDTDQYVSVSKDVCAEEEGLEEDPCSLIHNGSPAGESPMGNMAQCTR